jgi:hypothetical protein
MAGAGLLVAACGGGSHPAGGGDLASQNSAVAAASFARCMHGHGLPGLRVTHSSSAPGPNANIAAYLRGGLVVEGANGNSPQFNSAMGACQHLLGFRSAGPPTHQEFVQGLKTSQCMRTHGYPNWPDPPANIRGLEVPDNVDFSTPQFQAAAKACGYPVHPDG